jgi:hypothetical protein
MRVAALICFVGASSAAVISVRDSPPLTPYDPSKIPLGCDVDCQFKVIVKNDMLAFAKQVVCNNPDGTWVGTGMACNTPQLAPYDPSKLQEACHCADSLDSPNGLEVLCPNTDGTWKQIGMQCDPNLPMPYVPSQLPSNCDGFCQDFSAGLQWYCWPKNETSPTATGMGCPPGSYNIPPGNQ